MAPIDDEWVDTVDDAFVDTADDQWVDTEETTEVPKPRSGLLLMGAGN